jgi:glycosyltransferase involved in cell wall biosynthesis
LQVNCPGNASVLFWQKRYPDLQSKFVVLHSTIDTDYFKPDTDIKKVYDFIVLGRLAAIKRIDMIIKAFDEMIRSSNFENLPKLAIVGSGPEEQKLKHLATQLDLNHLITFTGFVENPVILLQQSRFLVMASSSEGLPTAMMQAMACEVVPMSNLVGNINDLIEENSTGLIHNGTINSVCQSMLVGLNLSSESYSELKRATREKMINYHSHHVSINKWNKLFKHPPYEKAD